MENLLCKEYVSNDEKEHIEIYNIKYIWTGSKELWSSERDEYEYN